MIRARALAGIVRVTASAGFDGLVANESRKSTISSCESGRESVASAQSHIAEGYGRFDPRDFSPLRKDIEASTIDVITISETPSIVGELLKRLAVSLLDMGTSDDGRRRIAELPASPEAKRNAEQLRQKWNERRRRRKDQD